MLNIVTDKKDTVLDKVQIVTAETAAKIANTLGVRFTKCGGFKKWFSPEEGIKLGSYVYTPIFNYNENPVILCFCKINGNKTGALGLVPVKEITNVNAKLVIESNYGYAKIADYLK